MCTHDGDGAILTHHGPCAGHRPTDGRPRNRVARQEKRRGTRERVVLEVAYDAAFKAG